MSKYIECEMACAEVDKCDLLVGNNAEFAKEIINRTPTADVVEVVRCRDCVHRQTVNCPMYHEEYIDWDDDGYWETDLIIHDATKDNGFCFCGERRK